jgi:hypothetical protein
MQVLRIAGVSILALGLVLGIALPALAAPDAPQAWAQDFEGQIVKGKVVSVEEGNQEFVIKAGEDEVTVKVDENTEYLKICVPGRLTSLAQHLRLRIHDRLSRPDDMDTPKLAPKLKHLRPFGEEASFSDIAVGDMVVAWLASEGDNLAERVQIIEPVTYARVSGTISVADNTITITPEEGDGVTLTYNEGTIFTLKGTTQVQSGQSAAAIYDSDNMLAKVVIVH